MFVVAPHLKSGHVRNDELDEEGHNYHAGSLEPAPTKQPRLVRPTFWAWHRHQFTSRGSAPHEHRLLHLKVISFREPKLWQRTSERYKNTTREPDNIH